jgi:hypothetical protein
MKSKRLIALALAGVPACLTTAPAGAMVHGHPVEPAAVPWFVSLPSCGATLAAPDRLLTAS